MEKKTEKTKKTKLTTRENTMVFGDNVRARKAARALPRTPTQGRRKNEEGRQKEKKNKATRPHTLTPAHPAIPQPTTQHNNTTHAHHTETHTTTHEESTVDNRRRTPFYPTQTITAIPQ